MGTRRLASASHALCPQKGPLLLPSLEPSPPPLALALASLSAPALWLLLRCCPAPASPRFCRVAPFERHLPAPALSAGLALLLSAGPASGHSILRLLLSKGLAMSC